jgi:MFS family permease
MIISFGLFQSYYITTLHRTQSDIAWIGSFAIFLLFFMGTIAGRLTDMGHLRPVIVGGAFTTLLGTFMTSISRTYWQLFLAQGVCVGLGNGFLFAPVMAVISTYFSSKKALAMGIAACGSVTGGLVFPSMARTLLYTIGFGWTMRAIGLIQLITLSLAVILLKLRVAPAPSKSLVDWSAFRDVEYCLYTAGAFVVSQSVLLKTHTSPGSSLGKRLYRSR